MLFWREFCAYVCIAVHTDQAHKNTHTHPPHLPLPPLIDIHTHIHTHTHIYTHSPFSPNTHTHTHIPPPPNTSLSLPHTHTNKPRLVKSRLLPEQSLTLHSSCLASSEEVCASLPKCHPSLKS